MVRALMWANPRTCHTQFCLLRLGVVTWRHHLVDIRGQRPKACGSSVFSGFPRKQGPKALPFSTVPGVASVPHRSADIPIESDLQRCPINIISGSVFCFGFNIIFRDTSICSCPLFGRLDGIWCEYSYGSGASEHDCTS